MKWFSLNTHSLAEGDSVKRTPYRHMQRVNHCNALFQGKHVSTSCADFGVLVSLREVWLGDRPKDAEGYSIVHLTAGNLGHSRRWICTTMSAVRRHRTPRTHRI
ncbi:hypothetical protein TGME49_203985 [Toxoplasma gondii ME49]|uniref:Uncharacterized protein n=3 Tax=Toxoplasma gondii TaxID=5811 RepID=A0A2G8XX11_TOXGO|nr:hypothetical protein TGME49_203985 [Toxoplasma gondii ME49]EPT30069.1 hypothetical protein TGME49_203985 [Toxoplasma gondii ME49]KYF44335.1 hypothetical protein TGARI_203985 [Toxoplasma gondii ARI]PIL99557.1 hypothetical protein TGCOUG_203985 [Toxoplasma gondii COUG]|eukprot:XP_018637327.1 hypothetical protein TGME49_203985 [Toxoplasma gondii ME49]